MWIFNRGGAVPSSMFCRTVHETNCLTILMIGLEKCLDLMSSVFSACANLAVPVNCVLLLTHIAITATAVATCRMPTSVDSRGGC
jgi:hypothetical protein